MRPPVTNEHFNARTMLLKAQAGDYPAASKAPYNRANREAEIAYWKARYQAQREQENKG